MAVKGVYSFSSADGVSTIHAVKWTPDNGDVKAVLQITYSLREMGSRFRAKGCITAGSWNG